MRAGANTIAAIATPAGRGGIGVVRISGAHVRTIAIALCGTLPPPRQALLRTFHDDARQPIDQGLALFFPAPHSFTGEDVLELHGHGGPIVLDLLLQRVLQLGAVCARAGEFSERAFLNGKLDLAQAEAVADLIDSGSAAAARAAVRSLSGEFSQRVNALVEALIGLRTHVEAAIDFPEEEIDFLAEPAVGERLDAARAHLSALVASAQQGRLLRDGMTVAIVGRPNAGKSSVLNALARYDAAIVSEVAGTTRDVVREHIALDGMPLHVLDTAGLRASADAVELEGMRRTHAALASADLALIVVDDSDNTAPLEALLTEMPPPLSYIIVRNKIDLSARAPGHVHSEARVEVALSARTGAGVEDLRTALKNHMGFCDTNEGTFSARRRHLDALARAHTHLAQAGAHWPGAGELLAEELRATQAALNEITGEFSADDLLGRIFASFCIGK